MWFGFLVGDKKDESRFWFWLGHWICEAVVSSVDFYSGQGNLVMQQFYDGDYAIWLEERKNFIHSVARK